MGTSPGPVRIVGAGLTLLIGLWGVLSIVAAYETYKTRTEAEQFLKELARLEVGKTTLDQMRPLITKYHGVWRRPPSPSLSSYPDLTPCGRGAPQVEFMFDNRWARLILLASRNYFSASLIFRDNRLCYRSASLVRVSADHDANIAKVSEYEEGRRSPRFELDITPSRAFTNLTSAATSTERTAAYAVNLDCLARLRGCRDTQEMVPIIWRIWNATDPSKKGPP